MMDLVLDFERGLDVDLVCVRADVGESSGETNPYRFCASASATQTWRHSLRRCSSEKSARNSARPYLHENGEA